MEKTTLAVLAAALVMVSIVQPVAAAQSHRSHGVHGASPPRTGSGAI